MLKWKRVICSVCLLVFILIPLPAFAVESDLLTSDDLFTGQDWEYVDGVAGGQNELNLYVDGVKQGSASSTFGQISDTSGVTSFDLSVYSSTLDWRVDETFTPTSSVGYSKLFTSSDLTNVFSGKICTSFEEWQTYMDGFFGYMLTLNLADDEYFANGSKLSLNLDFPATFYGGNSYYAGVGFYPDDDTAIRYGQFYRVYTGSASGRNNYISADVNPLLVTRSNYALTSEENQYNLYSSVVSVGGINQNGEIVILDTYENIDSLDTTFKLSEDLTDIFVDVTFQVSDGVFGYLELSPELYYGCYPLFYGVDISGDISVDDSGVISGLISGIVEWLRSILNAIIDLPSKIITGIQNVLTALFIPSAEDMASVYENATSLLEDRLGFIAQIVAWILELFDTLAGTVTDTQDTITVPRLALPWPADLPAYAQVAGNEIVIWEEFTFDIIPDGMDSLRNLLETVTSLWAVLALVMCCVDSYHGFVGESPMYRTSMEYQNTKDIAEEITGFRRKEHFGRRRW